MNLDAARATQPTVAFFAAMFFALVAHAVRAQSGALDPSRNYAGQPCYYFTKPALEADGGRLNTYAPGSIVVYGNYTYRCAGTWEVIANRPDFYSDWRSRHAAVIEGTGAAPDPGSGQQTLEDFVKSPGLRNSGGAGNSSNAGQGGNTTEPGIRASEIEDEILSELSTTTRGRIEGSNLSARDPRAPNADDNRGASAGVGSGSGGTNDAFTACRNHMASLPRAPTEGSQCGLARKLVDYVNSVEPGLVAHCSGHPEFPKFIAGLRDLRRTSQQTISKICVNY